MKIQGFLFWTFVLVEEESFVVEAMLTLVSTDILVFFFKLGCF